MLTLIGAGELMPAMSGAHREALARLAEPPRAVFLDTTAGFETNADAITAKAVEYYARRLQTRLDVACYRHAGRATAAETAQAMAALRAANFIFAGPGSPTYALQQWRGSPVWQVVVERFRAGAHLLFASAAAITLGRYALPVYEIYKAGRDPYWVEGLDLLGELGLNIAIVPHFNDSSGGDIYDSRFCYMGAARFEALQALLPPETAILGIDEYTTVTFPPGLEGAVVGGQGGATVIADGALSVWPAGAVIPFERLRSSRRAVVPMARREAGSLGYAYAEVGTEQAGAQAETAAGAAQRAFPRAESTSTETRPADAFAALAEYVEQLPGLDAATRVELLARVAAATRAAAEAATPPSREAALVDLVLELRGALRAARRWDLADHARDVLQSLGYRIADTPDGSSWTRE